MKGLVKRFGRGRITFHKPKNLESFTLLREGLAPLDAFETVRTVIVSRLVGHESTDRAPYIKAIRSHSEGRSRMNLTINGAETETGAPFEFRLEYGWQMEQRGDNFPNCTFQVAGTSRGVNDLGYRRDLFLRTIESIGLSGIIQVNWDGDDLYVSAFPEWEAAPVFSHVNGANPLGISIRGFTSIDVAVDKGELIIEQVLRRIDRCLFYAYAEKEEGYETLIRPLNAIAQGWKIEVGGWLSESAGSVLAGKPTGDAPSRVPAFIWEEKDGKERYSPRYFYSGELVATEEGYCLELTTDRNDLDRLMDYASSIDGLSFRQMDQAGP
jgi:hypothetical protein